MKAILCTKCWDFRALREGYAVSCECGNVEGWWTDPQKGTMQVWARDRDKAKVIGFMNQFLMASREVHDLSPARWKALHAVLTEDSVGYVFHDSQRGCPVAIIGVGNSTDTSWSDVRGVPMPPSTELENLRGFRAKIVKLAEESNDALAFATALRELLKMVKDEAKDEAV